MTNESRIRRILRIPFHPILVSSFPIIFLARNNLNHIDLDQIYRPLGLTLLFTLLSVAVLAKLFRNVDRGASLTSLFSLLFFSYGHVYNAKYQADDLSTNHRMHAILLLIWVAIFVLCAYLIIRKIHAFDWLNTLVNVMSLIMLGLTLSLFLTSLLNDSRGRPGLQADALSLPDVPPDIYYIVVDSYSRSDNLLNYYSFDNAYFMDYLTEQGFYIGSQSQANYLLTALSLSSSLNMETIHEIDPRRVPGTEANPQAWINQNRVRLDLEALGYSIVSLDSGWKYTQWTDADYLLTPNADRLESLLEGGSFTPFEGLLIETSLIKALIDFDTQRESCAVRFIQERIQAGIMVQRELILSQFDNLSASVGIPGPKFVFAHIISPHTPYFFGPHGETRIPEGTLTLFEEEDLPIGESEQRYLDQLTYVNARLMEAISAILTENRRPTIIILQSDHGHGNWPPESRNSPVADAHDRAGILNAYYLPDVCRQALYPTITPINTFRILFNCQFNGNFPLREDITWYGENEHLPIQEVMPGLSE